jgi:alcohol dehydrogenase class IV
MDVLSLLPKAYFPFVVYFGKNSLLYLKGLEGRNLVVVSKTVWARHEARLKSHLEKSEFFQFSSEPKKSDVERLHERVREDSYANVIGIGGGSVMDLAKTARLADGKVRLVMVPTTFGTGSEASRYSLVINESGAKEVLSSEKLVPDAVLLDPTFLASLPKSEIANSCMDVLAHSLEGLVSRMSAPLSDSLALRAIDMVFADAERAFESDVRALENLQVAGFLAGIVQSSASVGAVHAFAHYFGPKTGTPHGKAVGIFLPEVLRLNSQKTDKYKKLDSLRAVNSQNFVSRLEELMHKAGFSHRMDVSDIDLDEAAARIRNDVCMKTNPCMLSEEEIKGVIERIS